MTDDETASTLSGAIMTFGKAMSATGVNAFVQRQQLQTFQNLQTFPEPNLRWFGGRWVPGNCGRVSPTTTCLLQFCPRCASYEMSRWVRREKQTRRVAQWDVTSTWLAGDPYDYVKPVMRFVEDEVSVDFYACDPRGHIIAVDVSESPSTAAPIPVA